MDVKEDKEVWFVGFLKSKHCHQQMQMKYQLKNYKNHVIKKFKMRMVYGRFEYNIWATDLRDLESLSTNDQGIEHLLRIIDAFT